MGILPTRQTWTTSALLLLLLLLVAPLTSPADTSRCLLLGMDEWPPYEFTANGHPLGLATDIMLHILDQMDLCVESVHTFPWKRGLQRLREGDLDILFSADYRPERLEWAIYPEESLVDSGWVLYVRSDRKDLQQATSLSDLHGKTLGTVRGYAYPPDLLQFLDSQAFPDAVASDELNFRRLELGRIDALVCDRYNGAYLVDQLGLTNTVRVLPQEIASSSLYPLFSRKTFSPEEVSNFSEMLRIFKKDPAYQEYMQRWLPKNPSIPRSTTNAE